MKPWSALEALGSGVSTSGSTEMTRLTIPADQVEVLVVGHRVVGRRAVAEVGVADQAELLEHLERAVDRRDVDRRGVLRGPRPAPRRAWRGRAARPRPGSARAAGSAGSRCSRSRSRQSPSLIDVGPRAHCRAAAGPRCAAAAPAPSPPCRRRRAGRRRRSRRAACRRCTPWRWRCGRPRRSTISNRGCVGVDLAVPDLHEAGVVGQHHLEGAVLLRPQEPGLLGGLDGSRCPRRR